MSRRSRRAKEPASSGKPRRPFAFDDVPDDDVFSIDISGSHGIGKTHMALSFPEVVVVGDTELKAETVVRKFQRGGAKVLYKKVKVFDDFRQMVEYALDHDEVRTVVVDSGGDLVSLASIEWCSETGNKAVYPITNYKFVYQKIDDLTTELKDNRKFFVSTSRMKDEWIGDVSTGRRIRDGYKKFPWDLHLCIELGYGMRDNANKPHLQSEVFGRVLKSNFWSVDQQAGVVEGKPYLFDCSYAGIVAELLPRWGPHPLGSELNKVVEEAKEWIKQRG